ncbi:hypothetical protein Droror1_Dr00003548 [Drosera rotundifolia]
MHGSVLSNLLILTLESRAEPANTTVLLFPTHNQYTNTVDFFLCIAWEDSAGKNKCSQSQHLSLLIIIDPLVFLRRCHVIARKGDKTLLSHARIAGFAHPVSSNILSF